MRIRLLLISGVALGLAASAMGGASHLGDIADDAAGVVKVRGFRAASEMV
jgi:hypothetical protein